MSVELMEAHDKLHALVDEIDVKLDSLQDPETAGKTKLTNQYVAAEKETSDGVIADIVEQLKDSPIERQIGIYYGLVRGLNAAFKSEVEAAVAEKVKTLPKVEPLITEAEAADLMKVRSDLVGKIKQLIGMADIFGEVPEGMREAAKRTGKSGKRGPRALSLYDYSIDGEEFEDLNAVAAKYSEHYSKGSDIAAAMRGDYERPDKEDPSKMVKVRGTGKNADGTENTSYIDTTNPPEKGFSFTLPDGKVLVAVRSEDEPEPEPENSEVADSDEGPTETE